MHLTEADKNTLNGYEADAPTEGTCTICGDTAPLLEGECAECLAQNALAIINAAHAEAFDTHRETVRQAYDREAAEPKPEWVRGECPQCAAPVVSNLYYVGGRGYLVVWECWNSLGEKPSCTYRKVL